MIFSFFLTFLLTFFISPVEKSPDNCRGYYYTYEIHIFIDFISSDIDITPAEKKIDAIILSLSVRGLPVLSNSAIL
jgi:hypothetical protein